MSELRRVARIAGLAVAGTLSVVLGLVLAERLVRPDVIQEVRTPFLIALVMLFVLPVLTYFAVRQDERTAAWSASVRRTAPRRAETARAASQVSTILAEARLAQERPAPTTPTQPEAPLHPASVERAVRHHAHERDLPIPAHPRPAASPSGSSD